MPRKLRCLLYCQHTSGSGHFVRTYEIARALAEAHDVHLVDGGRPVPRAAPSDRVRLLSIPRIRRAGTGLAALGGDLSIEAAFADRRAALLSAVEQIEPDVLTVEHFPFSKWNLAPEIVSLIVHARKANPRVRVICSLRDIAPLTREDGLSANPRARTLDALRAWFDLLLVHTDPRFVRLDEQLEWAAQIPVPVHCTGFVSEKPAAPRAADNEGAARRPVVMSTGGANVAHLRPLVIEAWRLLCRRKATESRRLVVFQPLKAGSLTAPPAEESSAGNDIELRPFAVDFLAELSAAHLSVSQAGYNTCVNLLETRTRAVVIPNPAMSDQCLRAQRLENLGLAIAVPPEKLTPGIVAEAIARGLTGPRPSHDFDLDGAAATRRLIEQL